VCTENATPAEPLRLSLGPCCSILSLFFPSTFRRSNVPTFRCSDVQTFRRSSVPTFRCSDAQTFQRSSVPTFKRSDVQMFRRSNVPTFKRSDVQAFRRSNVPTFKRSDVQMFRYLPPSPIFRTLFKVPYPVSPAFATLTKTAGWRGGLAKPYPSFLNANRTSRRRRGWNRRGWRDRT
jgi:hypothetical protein